MTRSLNILWFPVEHTASKGSQRRKQIDIVPNLNDKITEYFRQFTPPPKRINVYLIEPKQLNERPFIRIMYLIFKLAKYGKY